MFCISNNKISLFCIYSLNIYFSLEFLTSSFISLISFGTLFLRTNSLWVISESMKTSEIKTSTLFNLDFANGNILLCFSFFFLIIDLYFLIHVVITQIFKHFANLVIAIWIITKEAKADMERYPLSVEIKTRKVLNIIQNFFHL